MLSLDTVNFSLPTLQPVASRLQTLEISYSRLRGSAVGFLSAGWTALKDLSLRDSWLEDDVLTAVNLPALEAVDIINYEHQGCTLRVDQLCCPQLRFLAFQLDSSQAHASEGSSHFCSLVNLPRLARLVVLLVPHQAIMDLSLPASLEVLTVQGSTGTDSVDLKWVLLEAAKGCRSGGHLRMLTCSDTAPSSHPEGMAWGASSFARYKELGGQLMGLTDLHVYGRATTLLSAISAVASSAPCLTCLKFGIEEELDDLVLPPISSASLKSITGRYRLTGQSVLPPQVALTFLPGCTQLRDARVQFHDSLPKKGTSVKICCHSTSQRCIVPLEDCAEDFDEDTIESGVMLEEVGIQLLPMPASPQDLQAYSILYSCHTNRPKQAPRWGHVVKPGIL